MEDIYSACLLNFYICTSCKNYLGIITTKHRNRSLWTSIGCFSFFFIAFRKIFWKCDISPLSSWKTVQPAVHPFLSHHSREVQELVPYCEHLWLLEGGKRKSPAAAFWACSSECWVIHGILASLREPVGNGWACSSGGENLGNTWKALGKPLESWEPTGDIFLLLSLEQT